MPFNIHGPLPWARTGSAKRDPCLGLTTAWFLFSRPIFITSFFTAPPVRPLCKDPKSSICLSFPQFSSVTQSCLTLCDPMNCSTPGLPSITNSLSSLRLMSIESVMPSSHLILCRPLLLLPPTPPSIGVFSSESTLHIRWPKYWSFSLSIIPSMMLDLTPLGWTG